MMRRHKATCATLGLAATLAIGLLTLAASDSEAQRRSKQQRPPPVAKEAPHSQLQEVKREQHPGAREAVQADVSARNVAVTSSFNGTEIVIFGAVDNNQQPSAESGYYVKEAESEAAGRRTGTGYEALQSRASGQITAKLL